MIYVGIDPGVGGALAVIHDEGANLSTAQVFDTPVMEIKGKRKYIIPEMALLLKPFIGTDVLVVLELVHSLPGQGVSSSFSFGEGLGLWKGILAAYGLSCENVSPQRWKKAMLSDLTKDKDVSRLKATQLFPALAKEFSRKKDDGRAEAILMAEYGRRLRKGQ